MLYPQDIKHIGYNIQCDNYAHTSNASNKKRYWIIKSMHVRVKLLDQHGWTIDQDVTQWLPTPTVNDNGKVSVGEVRQNDLAFRMNASSRKVLREVLSSIFIMEPNRRGSGIRRRRRCPGTKRVLGWSRLMFWYHGTLSNPITIQIYQNILKREYVCMGMHKHVTCKENYIMGSAQSNPTSTKPDNIYNTHLNA